MSPKRQNNTSRAPRASDEERRERRRAANRRSAQKSRYREMILMDELQKTVAELTKRNQKLRSDNESIRQQLQLLSASAVETLPSNSRKIMTTDRGSEANQSQLKCGARSMQSGLASILSIATNPERIEQPIDPMSLLPDKVFPFDGGVNEHNEQAMTTAHQLYKALMASSPSTPPLVADQPSNPYPPFLMEGV